MNITNIKDKILIFLNYLKNKVITLTQGRANFNHMLYLWGLLPALLIIIFIQRKLDMMTSGFLGFIYYFAILIYFSWHIFVIRKSLKVQPEYKKVKINDKELFKDKTDQEITEIKKARRKSRFRKVLLLEGWETTPPYIIITCLDVYVALTELQGIINIFYSK